MERRWYDQDSACPRLLRQMEAMRQPEVRDFCARLLNSCGEKIRKDIQHRQKTGAAGISTMGVSALTVRYKFGSQKLRWYDADPVLHKAVGMLYSLPQVGLTVLGYMLKDTFDLMEIYTAICDRIEQPVNLLELSNIASTALKEGKQEAELILIGLVGKELYQSFRSSLGVKQP